MLISLLCRLQVQTLHDATPLVPEYLTIFQDKSLNNQTSEIGHIVSYRHGGPTWPRKQDSQLGGN